MPQWDTLCRTAALAIAQGRPEALLPLLSDSVTVQTNVAGDGQGLDAAMRLLRCPASCWPLRKLNIENLLAEPTRASFDVLALHSVGQTDERFHFVQYGLRCVLQCEAGRITKLLFALRWSDGNTALLGAWQPSAGHLTPQDAVANPSCRSETERVQAAVFRFAWALDSYDPAAASFFLPDAQIHDGVHGASYSDPDAWLHAVWQAEDRQAFLQHTLRILQVQTEDTGVTVLARRLAPDRIGSKAIGLHNYFMDWFTMDYTFFWKECAGCRRIAALTITKHRVQEPALENLIG